MIDSSNTYSVGVTMYNSFYVEASSEDEARQIIQDMEATDLLRCRFQHHLYR